MSDDEIISAEIAEEWSEANNRRSAFQFLQNTTVMAVILVTLFISSTFMNIYFFII